MNDDVIIENISVIRIDYGDFYIEYLREFDNSSIVAYSNNEDMEDDVIILEDTRLGVFFNEPVINLFGVMDITKEEFKDIREFFRNQ